MRNAAWINNRLILLGKTKSGLARHMNLPAPRITEIIKGERQVQGHELVPLARYLEMDVETVSSRLFGHELEQHDAPMIRLFVRGEVRAGHFAESTEWSEEDWQLVTVPRPDQHRVHFGLRVAGPSMNQHYPEGTILVCVPIGDYDHAIQDGDHVIVQRRNDAGLVEATVKELQTDASGRRWLWPRSNHPEFQAPLPLPQNDRNAMHHHAGAAEIEIIAVVVADYRVRAAAQRR